MPRSRPDGVSPPSLLREAAPGWIFAIAVLRSCNHCDSFSLACQFSRWKSERPDWTRDFSKERCWPKGVASLVRATRRLGSSGWTGKLKLSVDTPEYFTPSGADATRSSAIARAVSPGCWSATPWTAITATRSSVILAPLALNHVAHDGYRASPFCASRTTGRTGSHCAQYRRP